MDPGYFFIGGAPKSGTTWLQRSLDLHPEIVCNGEGHLHECVVQPIVEMLAQYDKKLTAVAQIVYEGEPFYPRLTRQDQIEISRQVVAWLMARRNKPVTLEPVDVEVYEFRLTGMEGATARFVVECGAGTYIRSLANDLGKLHGAGAHLSEIVRTAVGEFTLDHAVSLAEL